MSAPRTRSRGSRTSSHRETALSADPAAALAAELGAAVGAELELERPAEAEHGDYATNVALRLAGARRRPPRELAEEIAAAAAGLGVVERAEVAGPGFVNVFLRDEWFVSALEAMLAGEPAEKTGKRIQVEMVSANPTGPITVAVGAQRRVRRRGRAAPRGGRATRSSASTTTTTPARRWTSSAPRSRRCGAGRSRPRTATTATTSASSRATTPSRRCATSIESVARALPHPHRHVAPPERDRGATCPRCSLRSRRTSRTARSGRRRRAFGDDKDRVVVRSDGTYTYYAADIAYVRDKLERGFDTRDVRPRRRPPRLRRAAPRGRGAARLRPGARRGADLPARQPHEGRRGDEDVEAERRHRHARRASSTRSASTPRAGTSSRAAPTRRSRSTSTSPRSARRRIPSTTSSTRTRASPASSATLLTTLSRHVTCH